MTVDTLPVLAAAPRLSAALVELTRTVAASVVLVRGTAGSAGSGVVWETPGLVLTNHHVVPGQTAELTIGDGRRVQGRVVRRAPELDLAALEVRDADLPPGLEIGVSDALRVGDLVLAVGNPMGERNAPSLGIVAAAPAEVLRLAITLRPGNSGGALVDAHGRLVGLPHMVTGSGLGLAVASRTVRQFLAGASTERAAADLLTWS